MASMSQWARNVLAVVGAAATIRLVYVTLQDRFSEDSPRGDPSSENGCAAAGAGERSTPVHEQGHKVRVYIDGCFDMMHFGHSNALRQARAAGDELVVGIVSDEEIVRQKGTPPVMPFAERYESVKACKWVDEVIPNAPYDLTKEWVDYLVEEKGIDYVVHGDDPCTTSDGADAYAYAKQIGRFRMVKRTEGVSTTDIVGRMLLHTREHHAPTHVDEDHPARSGSRVSLEEEMNRARKVCGSAFLPTTRRIVQFAEDRVPPPGARIVYIAGAFDLFHSGHVAALREAKKLGDFLIVGVHDDSSVNHQLGSGFPILNLYERALSVMSCRYADEVIIGAPCNITSNLIQTLNISVVAEGTVKDVAHAVNPREAEEQLEDALAVPRELGIVQQFESPSSLKVQDILNRILREREMFQKRFEGKNKKEAEYMSSRAYVEEA